MKTPTKEVSKNPLHAMANAVPSDPTRYVSAGDLDTTPFIQDCLSSNVESNMSSSTNNATNIADILDLADLPIQDITTTSHSSGIHGTERNNYVHENIELERTLPSHHSVTNKADNRVYVKSQHQNELELSRNVPTGHFTTNVVARGEEKQSSRKYRLNPKINPGGFDGVPSKPTLNRQGQIKAFETQKAALSRMAAETSQGRYSRPAPWSQ